MTLPNFLVIGAPRCGTTTLYSGLQEHPDIFMSPAKEPGFFASGGDSRPFRGPRDEQGVRELSDYRALFEGAAGHKAVGEASTIYLYSPAATANIRRRLGPDVKLIAILRNPADRAFSNFMQHVLQGREPLADFGAALAAEEARVQAGWAPFWFYRRMGLYAEQLERYRQAFPPEHLKVLLYDHLQQDPQAVYREVFSFLGVDPDFHVPNVARENASGVPRSESLHTFLAQRNAFKTLVKPLVPELWRRKFVAAVASANLIRPVPPPEIHRALLVSFVSDIERTQELTGLNLSHWLPA